MMSLKIPIINKRRTKTFIVLVSVFIIILIFLLGSIFYLDNKIAIVIAIALLITSGALINMIKGYLIIGELEFLNNEIVVLLTNEKEYRFPLEEVSNYKLKLDGFENESYYNPKSFGLKDGTNNFIDFYHDGMKYKFQLLLNRDNYFKIQQIII